MRPLDFASASTATRWACQPRPACLRTSIHTITHNQLFVQALRPTRRDDESGRERESLSKYEYVGAVVYKEML